AGFSLSDMTPTRAVFFGLVPVLLFNYVGFELQNAAAEEMDNPQHDVPISVLRSGIIGVLLYVVPIFGIILVLPAKAITGIGGFIDAVTTVFSVYGGAAHTLLILMTICFVGTLVTSGAVWMIGSDRIQAVASFDGAFFPWFGVFNRRFGTPVRVNVMSGVVSTIFCFSAIAFFDSGANSTFAIVLTIAISTTLISYLWIFTAALKLRYTHPHVNRPYRVPGKYGMWISATVITAWVALGSFAGIFPGVLEKVFGVPYNFGDNWGVTRGRYEIYTFGTLAVILAFGIVGYVAGAGVRRQVVQIEGDAPQPTAPVPTA
ncbi:MAG TPA: APC family permease, partial [Gaiellaceae bacterium]|nr:APC family permease [Gaiellaceae bacterium]